MINRQNYEEFFLLYVDKELDAEGQAAVEAFVGQNPDLGKELDLLRQLTLSDDNIIFSDKEVLYKKENGISLNNYEEYFVLSGDNELPKQQAEEVESFVLKHPHLQNEFLLLQQARLQPQQIAFGEKDKLYRYEQKIRKIVSISVLRVGAAAAIAGIVILSIIFYNSSSNTNQQVVVAPETPVKKLEAPVARQATKQPEALTALDKTAPSEKAVRNKAVAAAKTSVKPFKVASAIRVVERNEVAAVEHKKEAFTISPPENDMQKDGAETEIAKIENNAEKDVDVFVDDEPGTPTLVKAEGISIEDKERLFSRAVYLETETVEQEKSLYIGGAEINKNKLKGLFKKATGFFSKKLKENDIRNSDN